MDEQNEAQPLGDLVGRRAMLRGVVAGGAVVAGGSLLAACGSDSPEGASGDPSSSPTVQGSETTKAGGGNGGSDVLVTTDKVPQGGGVILSDDEVVVTQPSAGQFACFSSICTHMGCEVGDVSDGTISCPCHGSQYSIDDGSVVTGPATEPLPPVDITVDGDSVVRA